MAAIDRAVTENASSKQIWHKSLRLTFKEMIFTPRQYFFSKPDYWILWTLYFGTYSTSNIVEVLNRDKSLTVRESIRVPVVTVVNCLLTIWKDRTYSKMYGSAPNTAKVPLKSYGIWMIRDGFVIWCSFTLPGLISTYGEQKYGYNRDRLYTIAQLTTPSLSQFLATVLHLYGIDFYNRPNANAMERLVMLRRTYWSSTFMRFFRIWPPFALAPMINTNVRMYFRDNYEL